MTTVDLSPEIPLDTAKIYMLQYATQSKGVFVTSFMFVKDNGECSNTPNWVSNFGMGDFAEFEARVADWNKNVAMYEPDEIMAISYERQHA